MTSETRFLRFYTVVMSSATKADRSFMARRDSIYAIKIGIKNLN
jgi:hypothetical protein